MAFVLIHGGASTGQCWGRVAPLLGSPCLTPDLPGRGARAFDHATLTFEDCARQVLDDMDAAHIAEAHLVGHSLGGGTLLALALHAPERIASLTFLSAPIPENGGVIFSAIPEFAKAIIGEARDQGLATLPPLPAPANPPPSYLAGVEEAVGLFFRPIVLDGLSRLKRVAYLRTPKDRSMLVEVQDNAILRIGRFCTLHADDIDAGHMSMQTHPEALAEKLRQAAGV